MFQKIRLGGLVCNTHYTTAAEKKQASFYMKEREKTPDTLSYFVKEMGWPEQSAAACAGSASKKFPASGEIRVQELHGKTVFVKPAYHVYSQKTNP